MILTLTPNPALDRTLMIPALRPGEVHRATQTLVTAGGKGLNVARALKTLGGSPLAMGLLGGYHGRLLADYAAAEAMEAVWTWTAAETRTCVILAPENQDATVINEPGPIISADVWAQWTTDVVRMADQAQAVCLCGSLPPGCPDEAPADLITAVKRTGCQVWVDTSGPPLQTAMRARPDGVKVNVFEAAELLGQSAPPLAAERVTWAHTAVLRLRQMGVRTVVLTLGDQGAVLANDDGIWWGQPPPIRVVSSVGSGDAFLAGLLQALAGAESGPGMLRQAVAAGSANAMSVGGGTLSLAHVLQLSEKVTVAVLA